MVIRTQCVTLYDHPLPLLHPAARAHRGGQQRGLGGARCLSRVAGTHTHHPPAAHGLVFELGTDERLGLLALLDEARTALQASDAPQGYDIGVNDGPAGWGRSSQMRLALPVKLKQHTHWATASVRQVLDSTVIDKGCGFCSRQFVLTHKKVNLNTQFSVPNDLLPTLAVGIC